MTNWEMALVVFKAEKQEAYWAVRRESSQQEASQQYEQRTYRGGNPDAFLTVSLPGPPDLLLHTRLSLYLVLSVEACWLTSQLWLFLGVSPKLDPWATSLLSQPLHSMLSPSWVEGSDWPHQLTAAQYRKCRRDGSTFPTWIACSALFK